MKNIIKYIFLILILNHSSFLKADIIETNCLVRNYHLTDSNINPEDYNRFAGGIIDLRIDTNQKKITNLSEQIEMVLMSGVYLNQTLKYHGSGEFIRFRNKIEVESGEIKYDYRVKIKIFNNVFVEYLDVQVLQRGFSIQKWKFKIDCRTSKYTDEEVDSAKVFKTPKKDNLPNLNLDKVIEELIKKKK